MDYETVYGDNVEASVVPVAIGNYDAFLTITFAGVYNVESEVDGVVEIEN